MIGTLIGSRSARGGGQVLGKAVGGSGTRRASSSALHLHRACCGASAILVNACRQTTTKRFREVAVESSKYIKCIIGCPRCVGPAPCSSLRAAREAHQVESLRRKGRREVAAAQADDGGLMCAPLPVNRGQCCHDRMMGVGGPSCMWRVGNRESLVWCRWNTRPSSPLSGGRARHRSSILMHLI